MTTTQALEDLRKILDELRRRVMTVEAVSREVADVLNLIAKFQERMLDVLKQILSKLDEHSERLSRLESDMRVIKDKLGTLDERVERLEEDMKTVRTTIERIAGTLEEEACDIAMQVVEELTGKRVPLSKLVVEGIAEVDVYGVTDDICVLGEVKTRIGPSAVKTLCKALVRLYEARRDLLRDRVVLLTHGLRVIDVARRLAETHGIGVITSRGVLVRPKLMRLEEAVEVCRKVLE